MAYLLQEVDNHFNLNRRSFTGGLLSLGSLVLSPFRLLLPAPSSAGHGGLYQIQTPFGRALMALANKVRAHGRSLNMTQLSPSDQAYVIQGDILQRVYPTTRRMLDEIRQRYPQLNSAQLATVLTTRNGQFLNKVVHSADPSTLQSTHVESVVQWYRKTPPSVILEQTGITRDLEIIHGPPQQAAAQLEKSASSESLTDQRLRLIQQIITTQLVEPSGKRIEEDHMDWAEAGHWLTGELMQIEEELDSQTSSQKRDPPSQKAARPRFHDRKGSIDLVSVVVGLLILAILAYAITSSGSVHQTSLLIQKQWATLRWVLVGVVLFLVSSLYAFNPERRRLFRVLSDSWNPDPPAPTPVKPTIPRIPPWVWEALRIQTTTQDDSAIETFLTDPNRRQGHIERLVGYINNPRHTQRRAALLKDIEQFVQAYRHPPATTLITSLSPEERFDAHHGPFVAYLLQEVDNHFNLNRRSFTGGLLSLGSFVLSPFRLLLPSASRLVGPSSAVGSGIYQPKTPYSAVLIGAIAQKKPPSPGMPVREQFDRLLRLDLKIEVLGPEDQAHVIRADVLNRTIAAQARVFAEAKKNYPHINDQELGEVLGERKDQFLREMINSNDPNTLEADHVESVMRWYMETPPTVILEQTGAVDELEEKFGPPNPNPEAALSESLTAQRLRLIKEIITTELDNPRGEPGEEDHIDWAEARHWLTGELIQIEKELASQPSSQNGDPPSQKAERSRSHGRKGSIDWVSVVVGLVILTILAYAITSGPIHQMSLSLKENWATFKWVLVWIVLLLASAAAAASPNPQEQPPTGDLHEPVAPEQQEAPEELEWFVFADHPPLIQVLKKYNTLCFRRHTKLTRTIGTEQGLQRLHHETELQDEDDIVGYEPSDPNEQAIVSVSHLLIDVASFLEERLLGRAGPISVEEILERAEDLREFLQIPDAEYLLMEPVAIMNRDYNIDLSHPPSLYEPLTRSDNLTHGYWLAATNANGQLSLFTAGPPSRYPNYPNEPVGILIYTEESQAVLDVHTLGETRILLDRFRWEAGRFEQATTLRSDLEALGTRLIPAKEAPVQQQWLRRVSIMDVMIPEEGSPPTPAGLELERVAARLEQPAPAVDTFTSQSIDATLQRLGLDRVDSGRAIAEELLSDPTELFAQGLPRSIQQAILRILPQLRYESYSLEAAALWRLVCDTRTDANRQTVEAEIKKLQQMYPESDRLSHAELLRLLIHPHARDQKKAQAQQLKPYLNAYLQEEKTKENLPSVKLARLRLVGAFVAARFLADLDEEDFLSPLGDLLRNQGIDPNSRSVLLLRDFVHQFFANPNPQIRQALFRQMRSRGGVYLGGADYSGTTPISDLTARHFPERAFQFKVVSDSEPDTVRIEIYPVGPAHSTRTSYVTLNLAGELQHHRGEGFNPFENNLQETVKIESLPEDQLPDQNAIETLPDTPVSLQTVAQLTRLDQDPQGEALLKRLVERGLLPNNDRIPVAVLKKLADTATKFNQPFYLLSAFPRTLFGQNANDFEKKVSQFRYSLTKIWEEKLLSPAPYRERPRRLARMDSLFFAFEWTMYVGLGPTLRPTKLPIKISGLDLLAQTQDHFTDGPVIMYFARGLFVSVARFNDYLKQQDGPDGDAQPASWPLGIVGFSADFLFEEALVVFVVLFLAAGLIRWWRILTAHDRENNSPFDAWPEETTVGVEDVEGPHPAPKDWPQPQPVPTAALAVPLGSPLRETTAGARSLTTAL